MSNVLVVKNPVGYAVVTLNRPNAMNALSRQLREDFVAAMADCTADPTVRTLILTGAGKAFCAGFDLKELGSVATQTTADEVDNEVARAMEAFDGPIIGAINGHCITGGFEMALACDILIAGQSARFADTHARVGMLPGWGLSQKLPRLIGLSRAREIAFTGASISAERAYEWGLVNHVLPDQELMPKAVEIAENICGCVPEVLSRYQQLIEAGYSKPYDEALAWEESEATAWARHATGAAIEQRREQVISKGRDESSHGK